MSESGESDPDRTKKTEKLLLHLFLSDGDALFLKDLVLQLTNLEEIADLILEEIDILAQGLAKPSSIGVGISPRSLQVWPQRYPWHRLGPTKIQSISRRMSMVEGWITRRAAVPSEIVMAMSRLISATPIFTNFLLSLPVFCQFSSILVAFRTNPPLEIPYKSIG